MMEKNVFDPEITENNGEDEIVQMEFEDGTSENFYLLAELDYEG